MKLLEQRSLRIDRLEVCRGFGGIVIRKRREAVEGLPPLGVVPDKVRNAALLSQHGTAVAK